MRNTAIYIVTDHRFNKELLHHFLCCETDFSCVAANSLKEALRHAERADCEEFLVLLDYQSIEVENRTRLCFAVDEQPLTGLPLAIYNIPIGTNIEKRSMEAGVRGFFYENDPIEAVTKGIKAILAGEVWITREKMIHCLLGKKEETHNENGKQALTPREEEILNLVSRGFSNERIAEELFISPHTVKTHLYKTYKKINVTDRLQAALWAVNNL